MKISIEERAARLCRRPGRLSRWCGAVRRVRDDLRRRERESAALGHRTLSRTVRLFFEFLVLLVLGIAELDTLWRRAGSALAVRQRR